LVTRSFARGARPAAVSASTVFAIALAIVAGLIFAWLFKMVLLDKPKTTKPPDDTVDLTVAATNVYSKMEVKANQVKRVKVSKADFEAARKRRTSPMLVGNQPVGRVAKVPLKAEDPIYDDDLYELNYPVSVATKIRPGYRAVIVTVPAKDAMVQVSDYVDVYCTLDNDALGVGSKGTAQIAKGAQVVARFGTTREGAQPPKGPDAPREYTLEVTPYRDALIELAKSYGAKFSLAVQAATVEGERIIPPVGNDPADVREQRTGPLNGEDLAELFGIRPAVNGPGPWEVEKYVGIKRAGKTSYPNYVPPSRGGNGTTSGTPGANNRVQPAGDGTAGTSTPPTYNPSGSLASRQHVGDFRAPRDLEKPEGCPTCGKK